MNKQNNLPENTSGYSLVNIIYTKEDLKKDGQEEKQKSLSD